MKLLVGCLFVLLALPSHAEIYKCTINGKLEYSDQPCSEQAEVIELNIRQPQAEDIETQQQLTERYQDDARINEIESLNADNEQLKNQVTLLAKQWDAEMKALQEKTYAISDDRIATKEPGLFKKMDETQEKYQQKIEKLQDKIRQNKQRLAELTQATAE